MSVVVMIVIKWLHDLATIVWLGGLFTSTLIAMPAAQAAFEPGGAGLKFNQEMQHRLNRWVLGSMVVLVISGLLLAKESGRFLGLFSFGNDYSLVLAIKHILVVVALGLALLRRKRLSKQHEEGDQEPGSGGVGGANGAVGAGRVGGGGRATGAGRAGGAIIVYANLAIGAVILLLSAINALM